MAYSRLITGFTQLEKKHENEKKKNHIGNSQNNSKDFTLITHPASMPATIAQPISLYSSGVELPKATPWIEASGNIKWPEKYWVTDGSR